MHCRSLTVLFLSVLSVLAVLATWAAAAHGQGPEGLAPPPAPGTAPLLPDAPPVPVVEPASVGGPAGWFVSAEARFVRPSIHGTDIWGMNEPLIHHLDSTVSPRVALGYRFDGGGTFLASYSFLQSDVHTAVNFPFTDFSGEAHARLETQWGDLSYLSRPYGPWWHTRLQWEAGARLQAVTYEEGDPFLWVHTHRLGAGPHAGLTPAWAIGDTNLELYVRLDLGLLFSDASDVSGNHSTHTIVDSQGELGLRWSVLLPPLWLRLTGGLGGESYTVGGYSRGITEAGPFLRGELVF